MSADFDEECDLAHAQMQEINDCKDAKKCQKDDEESSTKQLTDLDSKTEFRKSKEQTAIINTQMNIQNVNRRESSSKLKLLAPENLNRVAKNLSKPKLIAEMNPILMDGASDSEGSQKQKETSKANDLQNLMKDLKDYKATRDLYGGVLQRLEESDSEPSAPNEMPIEGNETWQDFDAENDSINLFDDDEIGEVGYLEAPKPEVEALEPRVLEEPVPEDLVEDPRGPGYEYWESASTESISEMLDDDIQKDRRKTIFWTIFLFFSCLVIISCITIPTVITKQNAGRTQSKIEAPEQVEYISIKAEQSPEKIPVAKKQPNKDEITDMVISENQLPDNLKQRHNSHSDCSQENEKKVALPQNRKFMIKVVKHILVVAIVIAVVWALNAIDFGKIFESFIRTVPVSNVSVENNVVKNVSPLIVPMNDKCAETTFGKILEPVRDKVSVIETRMKNRYITPENYFEKVKRIKNCYSMNKDAEMCMNQVLKTKM